MIKLYGSRKSEKVVVPTADVGESISPVVSMATVDLQSNDDEFMCKAPPQGVRLRNTEILSSLSQYLSHLPIKHGDDIKTHL